MTSSDPFIPSLASVLVLHSSCHERDATTPEMAGFESAWRQLVATAKLSCDMILIPDMAVAHHQQHHQQQQTQNELDAHRSVVKFRNELLDPCGTYNVFSLSNLVADSYILSLTDCRLRPTIAVLPSSSDISLPAVPVPSTFHFAWNVSEVFQADADADANVNTNAYAEIRVDFDVTRAKRQFRKVWQNKESAKLITTTSAVTATTNATVAEEQREEVEEEEQDHCEQQHSNSTETEQVPPILVDSKSHSHVPIVNLPSCPAWEMPLLPSVRTGSIAHDPRFLHLEKLMESELNDINRILSFLAVTGLVLFASFLWTAFVHVSHTHTHSRSRASHTPQKTPGTRGSKYKQTKRDASLRKVPMESISMQAVSSGAGAGNLSPLSLDTILAAQGNCHGPSPSSPSALLLPLHQVKTARAEETPTSTITYGPKQRSSRRSRQPPLTVVPNKDNNNQDNRNEADPSLSPCSKLAQQWSRDKSTRRNLRRDGASRGVEESSIVTEGLATATAAATTTTTTTAATETKIPLPPVEVKPIRGRSGIAAAADVSVPFYGKSNDSMAAPAPVPAPVRVKNAIPSIPTMTENTRNAATSISIPEEYGLQQLLSPAIVLPGPAPRLRPALSTVDQNDDSSFVHEYWGARAM